MRLNSCRGLLAGLVLAGGGMPARAGEAAGTGFAGADWIWYSREPMPASIHFPAGRAWFRGSIELPEGAVAADAGLVLACDNLWVAHVNGQAVGAGEMNPDAWSRARRIDVAKHLHGGRNTLAVAAANTAAGPAGLLASLRVTLADGREVALASDAGWSCSDREQTGWEQPGFDDSGWQAAHVVGAFGMAPWGAVAWPVALTAAGPPPAAELRRFRQLAEAARRGGRGGPPVPRLREARPGEAWPAALAFVGGDCSLYRPPAHTGTSRDSLSVTIFNPHHGRAYPEHDLPAPVKIGRRLMVLRPARPGVAPQVLWDAGQGALGAPAVSFDGRWIYFSMAAAGEGFFHLWRIPAAGGAAERLTDGPFHDTDPCELPDGRLVFSSTRAGTFEEYHNPPSRALFVIETDGRIRPLTRTFQFDNEAKVLADGRLLMLRTDNFFDRGKVETMLHAIFPDGSGGHTEFGLDLGPEYGNRLRAFNAGSAAPMPDGRVAWVDGAAVQVARPGAPAAHWRRLGVAAADVSALADGRLVCTVAAGGAGGAAGDWPFCAIGLLEPDAAEPDEVLLLHEATDGPVHSPVALGPRPRPPLLVERVGADEKPGQTGFFYCQDIGITRHHTAGWGQVRAVRVLAGYGLTLRSSHSYLVHAGSEVVELGTVPLAPDGSFAIEVPADTAIALQAVDAEGRSEINQMSWMFVRPGETRGCVGCHQPRQTAPPPAGGGILQALAAPPLKLTGRGDPPRFRGNNAAVTGLMELQFDRFRETAGLNNHGRGDAPGKEASSDLAILIDDLESRDPARRHAAAQRAALFRVPEAAPALAACLKSGDRELRVAAALALASCGTAASVEPLAGALGDPDPLVARAAAIALENLRGEAVDGFDAFAPVAARRAAAVEALLDPPGGPDWLARRAADLAAGDRDRARRAAVALARSGGSEAAPALAQAFLAGRNLNPYPAWRADHRHRGDGARFNSLAEVNPRAQQEVARALGACGGAAAVPMLAETVAANLDPETGNLFLAEAAVEGLARAGPAAESAMLDLLGKLPPYFTHSRWYGDHDALIACHAGPVHARLVAALDRLGSSGAGPLVPALVRLVPTDPDRALMPGSDDLENLVGRVIRRSGRGGELVESCLHALGDPAATPDAGLLAALGDVHAAWAGRPCREIRAAQILSLAARDPAAGPRVLDAFIRYRGRPNPIPRVYDKGIPVVTELPPRHWVCFYLARTLGQLGNRAAAGPLVESLRDELAEAAAGRPDPLGPGVLFLHDDLTPCWRAAAAWALGRLGDPAALPALRGVLANLENAPDTRHAAAVALGRLTPPGERPALAALAAGVPEVSVRQALLEAAAGRGE
jgi:HEAT repeat protein